MIAVLGINYKTAPINVRESFSISTEDVKPFSELVLQQTEVSEIVVLSTCNRTEIYFYLAKACCNRSQRQVIDILHQFKGVKEDYSELFYVRKEREAAKHLFQVTSGIDSLVIGEDQIVKQVKEAYVLSTKLALADAVLMRLFQKSFETGKKVRTRTAIQKGATSVSLVAVDKCAKLIGGYEGKKVMLIGAGDTNRIALQHLKKKGCTDFIFTNRTFAKAQEWASNQGCLAVPFEDFKMHLHECDIVITATSAGRILVTSEDVEKYQNNGTKRIFVDLSIPRNIEESVNDIKNTEVICVDDLEGVVAETRESRMESIVQAGSIIDGMIEEYFEWLDIRVLRPVIKAVTSNLQKLHLSELEISKPCYKPNEYKLIEEYSARLTQKVIRRVITSLKDLSIHEKEITTLKKIQELFEFDED